MRVYADQAAFEAEYDDVAAPSNLVTLLTAASGIVDRLLVGVVYDTDAEGLPVDDDVAELLSAATCALVAEWVALASTKPGGSNGEWDTVKIGSVSLSKLAGTKITGPTIDGLPVPPLAVTLLAQVGPVCFTVLS